jgi:hypothetical protein
VFLSGLAWNRSEQTNDGFAGTPAFRVLRCSVVSCSLKRGGVVKVDIICYATAKIKISDA